MNTTWIVLANASRARIFESKNEHRAREVATLVHPASRMSAAELGAERAGHSERHNRDIGSAYEPPTDAHRKEHAQFARELAQAVHEGVVARRCDTVLLVASNPFLGELKACLSDAASRAVVEYVAKDLTELATLELQHRLAELLAARKEA